MEDVTPRRRAETERNAALERANSLLVELNHRVMNSLAMIGSVIAMEARNLDDEECRAAFGRLRGRIGSIGALYRNLTQSGAVNHVPADRYLAAILADVVGSVSPDGVQVRLYLDIEAVPLPTGLAVNLGLIVNELATNSMKYGFDGRGQGVLGLSLRSLAAGLDIEIWDDGSGVDENAGLGQRLTQAFATQLGGGLKLVPSAVGARYMLAIARSQLT